MQGTTGLIQRLGVNTWRLVWASVAPGRADVVVAVVRGGGRAGVEELGLVRQLAAGQPPGAR